jgi:mannan endo-1,4-beta-mannosidase
VYQDELVNLLVQTLGRADQRGARFYALDNEPALWPTTHPRVHPKRTTYGEVIRRTEATAVAITKLDPGATVLGGVMFGWSEFQSLSSAPDAEQHNQQYGTYIDFFLAESKRLEQKHQRRLVHVLDVHWYPEPRGTKRITLKDASRKTIDVRLAATRSLWDPDYLESSWIADQWKKPIRLIPWLLEKIAQRYPGTKLAMTEYNYGAGDHISGGLAQADVLGIFGREGMFLGNYWGNGAGVGKLPKFIVPAFQLYRNYDGKGGRFGDTAVAATVADITKASIYAATDSKRPGVLTVVIINKSQQDIYEGRVRLGDQTKYTRAEAFGFDARRPKIGRRKGARIDGNVLSYSLPPLSASRSFTGLPRWSAAPGQRAGSAPAWRVATVS